MPFRNFSGFGGGATGLASSSGDAWEEAGITATGGTVVNGQENPDGTPYTWHVFPGGPRGPVSPMPYTFSVSAVSGPGKIEYIMVAGGGLGGVSPNPDPGSPTGYGGAGGGGAGGVICNFQSPPANPGSNHPFYPVSPGAMTVSASPGSYAIEVGRAGGGNPAPERNGKDTTFNGLTAKGGGAGARSGSGLSAQPGGSGGGGSANATSGSGPNSPTQGNAGGDGNPGNALEGNGGGGGGAGGAGQTPPSATGGVGIMFDDAGYFKLGSAIGGIADNPTQPTYRYLAGGGGGGGTSDNSGNPPGIGGYGGGGDSSNPGNNPGSGGNADNWSGGGGGAAGGGSNTMPGGLGGQGMLFIRYIKNS